MIPDKPIKNTYSLLYSPIVTITVEEFEDGTFDTKKHPYVDWGDSYLYLFNNDGEDINDNRDALPNEAWTAVQRLIDSLALKEHYQAWTPEDEPF